MSPELCAVCQEAGENVPATHRTTNLDPMAWGALPVPVCDLCDALSRVSPESWAAVTTGEIAPVFMTIMDRAFESGAGEVHVRPRTEPGAEWDTTVHGLIALVAGDEETIEIGSYHVDRTVDGFRVVRA